MDLERIRRFVGGSVALFVPATGQCGYAISPQVPYEEQQAEEIALRCGDKE